MPVRGKTRHDPPMPKQPKGPSMFAATDSGEKPHGSLLKEALKVSPKARIGGKKTLTR
jgi:hypothetical protein